jgi:hypothetical protein
MGNLSDIVARPLAELGPRFLHLPREHRQRQLEGVGEAPG